MESKMDARDAGAGKRIETCQFLRRATRGVPGVRVQSKSPLSRGSEPLSLDPV